jgi:hypothetical protein
MFLQVALGALGVLHHFKRLLRRYGGSPHAEPSPGPPSRPSPTDASAHEPDVFLLLLLGAVSLSADLMRHVGTTQPRAATRAPHNDATVSAGASPVRPALRTLLR